MSGEVSVRYGVNPKALLEESVGKLERSPYIQADFSTDLVAMHSGTSFPVARESMESGCRPILPPYDGKSEWVDGCLGLQYKRIGDNAALGVSLYGARAQIGHRPLQLGRPITGNPHNGEPSFGITPDTQESFQAISVVASVGAGQCALRLYGLRPAQTWEVLCNPDKSDVIGAMRRRECTASDLGRLLNILYSPFLDKGTTKPGLISSAVEPGALPGIVLPPLDLALDGLPAVAQ